jgi:5S rRNA maturation endonuclease (ribonuclease M5)
MIQTLSLMESIELAKTGAQSMTPCPAHDDGNASLHVAPGTTQPVVMTCHAGCRIEDILLEGRIDPQSLMAPRDEMDTRAPEGEWTPAGPASHIYPYTDEEGTLLFEVLRIPQEGGNKTFRQRHPDPEKKSGWTWNMDGVRRVPYRLPEVLAAKAEGRTIYIVEGEKDVETLRRRGEVATTSPMGAGKWSPAFSELLSACNIVIVPDTDTPGRTHARMVREQLMDHGCTVSVREPMNGAKDITEHFEKGGSLASLLETIGEVDEVRVSYGVDVLDVIKRIISPTSFVIPNVLAQGDRLLITGFEGHGKSTLCRQLAVMAACGMHPWTGLAIPPVRTVVVDSENHPDQVLDSWKQLIGLCARHGHQLQPGMLTVIEEWDNDLDLTSEDGHAWMQERVRAYKPQLMVIGPLYNLSSKDLKDDETARKIKKTVNDARGICGTAFIMEHHAPHRAPGDTKRSVRPYGSSTFLKWPDFGYGLAPMETEGVYEWMKTRFPRVRTRNFPTHLRWGKPESLEMPWMPAEVDGNGQVIG